MDYIEWNNLIAKNFFNETNEGKEVFLYVNDEVIEKIGKPSKSGVEDFIRAIQVGPSCVKAEGICKKAYNTFKNWRKKIDIEFEYPPYIGYLAFLVLASVTETDYAPHSYYPRFWKLLGEKEDKGKPKYFYKMEELWYDLEKWSVEEKGEEIGRFVVRIRGGYCHVGIPRSQTILSEYERKHLPTIFDRAMLDPTDPPPSELISRILMEYGKDTLEKQTKKLLENVQENTELQSLLKKALGEYVLDELEEWDGTVEYIISEEKKPSQKVHTGLRICLLLDSVARQVTSYFRFKTTRPFPEDGLDLKYNDDNRIWYCVEEYGGWSKPIRHYDKDGSSIRLSASLFDWTKGAHLVDEENRWHARLRGRDTRLFRLKIDGLPDWIETQKLERNIEFLIACQGDDIVKVINWGKDCCEVFEDLSFSGLPQEWRMFHGKNASESCPGIDVLIISSSARLVLKGGIKAGRTNRYFSFAPPKIALENASGVISVTLNGSTLKQPDNDIPLWLLPTEAPIGIPLHVEAQINDQYIKRIFRLVDFKMPLLFNPPHRGRDGIIMSDNSNNDFVTGGIANIWEKISAFPKFLPVHFSDRIIYLGQRPGEVTDWPKEPLPIGWHPVWAVAKKGRKHWEIHFCGSEEQATEKHGPGDPVKDRRERRRWREVIWIQRKINKKPDIPQLKKVWNKYEKVAKKCR